MAITNEQIIDTANALKAQGINPTQVLVREKLGQGSFSTIGAVLREWRKSNQTPTVYDEDAIQVPDQFRADLGLIAERLWQSAVERVNKSLEAEREALRAVETEAREKISDAEQAVSFLENEISSLESEKQSMVMEVRNREAEIDSWYERAIAAEAKAAAQQKEIANLKEIIEKFSDKKPATKKPAPKKTETKGKLL